MSDVHLFLPSFDVEECLDAVRACLEKGWTGLGDQTVVFENAFCAALGHAHAHFVNSATAGLHLAVNVLKKARGWADGDEIITTPMTFVSTNHAILYENLTPVFADVDEYLCLDPASAAQLIGPRTRAVMFVGLGGNTGQLAAVLELCRRHGLALILDAAHMAGTRLWGANPALDADAAVYSFQAVKNLPTGDSGMVCFTDPADDATARKQSWLGIDKDTFRRMNGDRGYSWRYDVEDLGFKYNGNSIMAAIALTQLKQLERGNERRRELSALYIDRLFMKNNITIVPTAPGCVSSRHLFQVRVEGRDGLIDQLNERRIFPGVHYRSNQEYGLYRQMRGSCPKADAASRSALSLPLHLRLADADVHRVASALIELTG